MELNIKPFHKNSFPLHGILIKDTSAAAWLKEIKILNLNFKEISIYPLPGTIANTIWGCLVICRQKTDSKQAGKHELCQMVMPGLFIPEKSTLYPLLSIHEIEKLFPANIHIFHPEFGLVELTEELNLEALIEEPVLKSYHVTKPDKPVFIPKRIRSFQVKALTPEEVLKNMEESLFPQHEAMPDEELSGFEKAKLAFYKMLFTKNKTDGKEGTDETKGINSTDKTGFGKAIESLLNAITPKNSKLGDKIRQDFEDLERRNQKQIDKLMDLFKNNPEEALKYAIPLDETGGVRGGEKMQLDLSKRWSDFSLLNHTSGSGSGSIDLGDHYYQLQKQYTETAEELVKKKEYHKAAFVYMKLLKNTTMAALTLENGSHYQEAATIYLKHAGNKAKAAECYEKGKMTIEAIDLYKELNQDEKVGDLYVTINKRKEADVYFEKVVDTYKTKDQYLKASLVYKHKMNNEPGSQSLLLEGWRNHKDAFTCLNNYFSNIGDVKTLKNEINTIYRNDLSDHNSETFLQVIKHEYNKKNELSESIQDMAYEIIAAQIPYNPAIVSEIKEFNKPDKELVKDALRFRNKRKK
ncbi:MAG: hypothetical protein V4506_09310 [Bacteroidota bacterium]